MSAAAFWTFFDNRAQCYAGNTNALNAEWCGLSSRHGVARRAMKLLEDEWRIEAR
jgi:hypothetical protein